MKFKHLILKGHRNNLVCSNQLHSKLSLLIVTLAMMKILQTRIKIKKKNLFTINPTIALKLSSLFHRKILYESFVIILLNNLSLKISFLL